MRLKPRRVAVECCDGGGDRTHSLLVKKIISIEYNLKKRCLHFEPLFLWPLSSIMVVVIIVCVVDLLKKSLV